MKFELDDYTKKMLAWLAVTVVTILISTFLGVKYPVPAPPAFDSPVSLGVTHLTGLAIGDGTPDLAAGDDDLYVEGDLEVDDELELDGALDADSTVDIAGALTLSAATGNALVISSGGDADVNGKIDLDGHADEVQLAVTGYTTQTSDLVQFDGGLVDIGGATYTVADGDDDLGVAGVLEVDGEFELDGALDADSTANIQGAVTLQSTLDVGSTVNYGSNNLYPLGYSSSGYAIDIGTYTVTTTQEVSLSNVTTPTVCLCTLLDDAASTNSFCSCNISGTTVTLKAWEEDATEGTTGASMSYLVIGQE